MRRTRAGVVGERAGKPGLLGVVLLVATLSAGWAGAVVAQAQEDEGPARAGLVIHMPDGQVRAMCVALGADEITGEALLRQAGVSVSARVTPLGMMVCGLDEMGCDHPSEPCWCSCRSLGEGCAYWAYHVREDGGWRYAPLGPSARRVRHGDVDGWAWGAGSVVAGAKPPERSWAELCGDAATGRAAAVPTVERTVAAGGEGGGESASRATAIATPAPGGEASWDEGSARGDGVAAPPKASATVRAGAGGAGMAAGSPTDVAEPGGTGDAAGNGDGRADEGDAVGGVGAGAGSDDDARRQGGAALREATRKPASVGAGVDGAGIETRDSGTRPRRQPRGEPGGGEEGAPVLGVDREDDRAARLGEDEAARAARRRGDYLFFGLIAALVAAGTWWLRRAA